MCAADERMAAARRSPQPRSSARTKTTLGLVGDTAAAAAWNAASDASTEAVRSAETCFTVAPSFHWRSRGREQRGGAEEDGALPDDASLRHWRLMSNASRH